jgi:Zn-dependent membrane protease YugP
VSALILFFVAPMILGFWAQHRVKSTFAKNLEVPVANGMTGAQVARRILDANGLNEVPVEETPGTLSDHYDPRSRSVHLSPHVFQGVSVASTAVGAHEVGHAIQHAQAYSFFRFRSAMFPVVQFASNIWILFLLGGFFFQLTGFIVLAIALYAVAVLFQIVTLPVEFDASRRAKRQLQDLGLVASNEATGVNATLKAAAWTYVAAALAAVAVLLYYLSLLSNR